MTGQEALEVDLFFVKFSVDLIPLFICYLPFMYSFYLFVISVTYYFGIWNLQPSVAHVLLIFWCYFY